MTDYAETNTSALHRSDFSDAGSRRNTAMARRISLKPYGDELLTSSGDFWIFSSRLLILAMALAEAIAWGYVGSLISSAYPVTTAAITATFVFVLIWIIDTSFMTLDLSRNRYERAFHGKGGAHRTEILKLAGGVLARLSIVTASLVITAPFLAQAIFAGDVREEMDRRNAAIVSSQRDTIERPHLERIEDLRREQRVLEQQRIDEAAGIGPSGRHGRGPALETVERQLSEKRSEVAAAEQARSEALARFDALDPVELEQRYGLSFISPGVNSSAIVLATLSDDPLFGRAELAVRAFLAFLFLGLLILKAFQPRSISIYFSEQLHSLYASYRQGVFDSYLPAPERAGTGGSIDPLRFEEWCLTTCAAIRDEEQARRRAASAARSFQMRVEQWEQLEVSARRELAPLNHQLDEISRVVTQLEQEIHHQRSTVAALSDELRHAVDAHESMLRHLDDGMKGSIFAQAVDTIAQLDERRRGLQSQIRELEGTIEGTKGRLSLLEQERSELHRQIETKQSVVRDAQKRISDERLAFSRLVMNDTPA